MKTCKSFLYKTTIRHIWTLRRRVIRIYSTEISEISIYFDVRFQHTWISITRNTIIVTIDQVCDRVRSHSKMPKVFSHDFVLGSKIRIKSLKNTGYTQPPWLNTEYTTHSRPSNVLIIALKLKFNFTPLRSDRLYLRDRDYTPS